MFSSWFSLRESLERVFGGDALSGLRSDILLEDYGRDYDVARRWQAIDRFVTKEFSKSCYIISTEIHDEYIAYNVRALGYDITLITLAMFPDEKLSQNTIDEVAALSTAYAPVLLCVWVKDHKYRASVLSHTLSTVKYNGEQSVLLPWQTEISALYHSLTVRALISSDRALFDLVFDKDLRIEDDYSTLASGRDEAFDYICGKRLCAYYIKQRKMDQFLRLACEPIEFLEGGFGDEMYKREFTNHNFCHLCYAYLTDGNFPIKKLTKKHYFYPHVIHEKDLNDDAVATIPDIVSVRVLNVKQVHCYAIEAQFANGKTKCLVLHTFKTATVTDTFEYGGRHFDIKIACSVAQDKKAVVFDNGCTIGADCIYLRGISRNTGVKEDVESTDAIEYLYSLAADRDYFYTHLDSDGKPTNDNIFEYIPNLTKAEPSVALSALTGNYGTVDKDCNFILPPIFDSISKRDGDGVCIAKKGDTRYFITDSGKVAVFDYIDDDIYFSQGLAIVNTQERDDATAPCSIRRIGLKAGKWGAVDKDGNTVIKPQYLYMYDFNRQGIAIAAREIDEKVVFGAIDTQGNTVIPFEYGEMYEDYGRQAICFSHQDDTRFGVMDFGGSILLEPTFERIDEVIADKDLVIAGDDEDEMGVFSLTEQRFIIPPEYTYIDVYDDYIECENYLDEVCFYDHSGKIIDKPEEDEQVYNGLTKTVSDTHRGVSRESGEQVLPCEFFDIELWDGLIIAYTDGYARCSLYSEDGALLLGDGYKNIVIKNGLIYADTPDTTRVFKLK